MKLVKGWVPWRRKKDYICREKLVIGYTDQLNSLWHITQFLHLNRLCQTQHGGFLQAEECFFTYILKISISRLKHLLSMSINRRAHLLPHTWWTHSTQGKTGMPKTIFEKFISSWFEGICLAFHLCQGLKKSPEELHQRKPILFNMCWENAANWFHH